MPTVTITSSEHASHRLHGFPPVLSNFIILSCVVFLPCENTKKILHFGKKTVILHKKSSVWGLTCGWQHGAGPPGVFRKAVFCIAKGHQSHAKRPPFAGQKTAFYKPSGNVLTVSELRFAVKTTPHQPVSCHLLTCISSLVDSSLVTCKLKKTWKKEKQGCALRPVLRVRST